MPENIKKTEALYCMGFWPIENNQKRNSDHYKRLLPESMKLLRGKRLHLFYDGEEIGESFVAEAERNDVEVSKSRIRISDLPTYDAVLPIISTCERLVSEGKHHEEMPAREKMSMHLKRDYLLSGADAFRSMVTIWTSKLPLLADLSSSAPAGVKSVAWVDASIAKFKGSRTNWNFMRQTWPHNRVGHYASPMFFHGAPLPLNASFLAASIELWPKVNALFLEELAKKAGDGYVHDEETIMSGVVTQNPELFYTLGKPVRGIRRLPLKLASLFQ
ncbi:hypothetical protein [Thioclava electrotropha]|uniref:Uncharacterized protein n=1 Tax=Thioclava electrotropha TaxID=1549850 RepID=A0ABX6YV12_9RHOB|nr:hypothetical protein [Thioclava electrotropha]QPZ91610.1 hypothetical protein AKL02_012355 [Thioclava electrotropha]